MIVVAMQMLFVLFGYLLDTQCSNFSQILYFKELWYANVNSDKNLGGKIHSYSKLVTGNEYKFVVKNQCCGSGMFIPDPDFYPSRIPDLGSNNNNRRGGGINL